MTKSSDSSPFPVVETVPLGTGLPESEKIVFARNHAVDGVIDLIGGTVGGVANVYVGQPLDTVKVKLQTFPTMYRNALHCFVQTYKQDGIARGLYAGTVPALAANIAENSILFLFYGLCQKGVAFVTRKADVKHLNPLENAIAGGSAAFFSTISLCPTELVKCRLQAMREMATQGKLEGGMERLKIGPWGLTSEILRQEGIRGLFKGFTATMMREMPGYFFFFGGYEIARRIVTPPGKSKDEIGALRTVLCGGIGGVSLWVAIFPADVVKSRIQVECTVGSVEPTFRAMFMKIFREEAQILNTPGTVKQVTNAGFLALYKGLGPTVLRTFPATGALFLAFENTKKWLTYLADKVF